MRKVVTSLYGRRKPWVATVCAVVLALSLSGATPSVATSTDQAVACAALNSTLLKPVDGHHAQITAATVVPASATTPAYCEVLGSVNVRARDSQSTINIEARLPLAAWNGRYAQFGGGGFCGTIPTQSGSGDQALRRGFAVASDDSGHVGTPLDATFAYNKYATALTWGLLSEHLTALFAEQVLETTFGTDATTSVFLGCSTGGRQALVLAQRFPDDFDGIVAGAPANRQNELAPLSQGVRELQNRDSNRRAILDADAARVVEDAVLDRCDARDGVNDGIVNDPRGCPFAPASVRCETGPGTDCLTAEQVDVLRAWYDSPRRASGTELYPGGLPVGSESGWPAVNIGTDATLSVSGMFSQEVLRYLAFKRDPGPTYSLYDFDPDRDAARLQELDQLYNADSTDMREFERGGGKLILWHGYADPLITPYGSIQYYEDVVDADGGSLHRTQRWFRSFFLPGVAHCSGGPGPDKVDWLNAITRWVDDDQAPRRVVATKTGADGSTSMTRPLYPYPLQAAYDGTGDTNSAHNFHPVRGPRGREVAIGS